MIQYVFDIPEQEIPRFKNRFCNCALSPVKEKEQSKIVILENVVLEPLLRKQKSPETEYHENERNADFDISEVSIY